MTTNTLVAAMCCGVLVINRLELPHYIAALAFFALMFGIVTLLRGARNGKGGE